VVKFYVLNKFSSPELWQLKIGIGFGRSSVALKFYLFYHLFLLTLYLHTVAKGRVCCYLVVCFKLA